jgi:HB1, ASXL, restriction endonuclease HTH domain
MLCISAAQVLAEAGPDGLSVGEIVRRIQSSGLRDLRSSRNPDASVSGALARDVIFWKVSPARFALHAVVAHHRCGHVGVWTAAAVQAWWSRCVLWPGLHVML